MKEKEMMLLEVLPEIKRRISQKPIFIDKSNVLQRISLTFAQFLLFDRIYLIFRFEFSIAQKQRETEVYFRSVTVFYKSITYLKG